MATLRPRARLNRMLYWQHISSFFFLVVVVYLFYLLFLLHVSPFDMKILPRMKARREVAVVTPVNPAKADFASDDPDEGLFPG